jgi:PhoD-like phosphatase
MPPKGIAVEWQVATDGALGTSPGPARSRDSGALFPWAVTWDDHEVANDSSGIYPEFDKTRQWFLKRRAAAYQAWFEHMPVPRTDLRMVSTVSRPDAPVSTFASFVVEDGLPGAQKV